MIALAGTIGAGKTSLTKLLADHLNSQAFYESVDDNKILPLFYKDPKKYGFLLQIYFLRTVERLPHTSDFGLYDYSFDTVAYYNFDNRDYFDIFFLNLLCSYLYKFYIKINI